MESCRVGRGTRPTCLISDCGILAWVSYLDPPYIYIYIYYTGLIEEIAD